MVKVLLSAFCNLIVRSKECKGTTGEAKEEPAKVLHKVHGTEYMVLGTWYRVLVFDIYFKEEPAKVEHPLPAGRDDQGEASHERDGQQHHRPFPAKQPCEQGCIWYMILVLVHGTWTLGTWHNVHGIAICDLVLGILYLVLGT